MRKHVEESVATGAAAGRGRGGRFSAGRKREVVMRLLRGEDLESVSRAVGITAARASHWRAQFLAAGQAGLKSRATGTQLEAWASLKSFRCVDAAESDPPEDPGNPTVNFHGERRRNDTHQSTTDPEAMLHRKGKGKEAKLAYLGHVLLDNRQGLVANVCATHATGTAERDAAVLLLEASASPGSTVGADKGYDVARFVADVRVQTCPIPPRR